jgi:hypothetical protein
MVTVPTTKAPCEFAVMVWPLTTIDGAAVVVTPPAGTAVVGLPPPGTVTGEDCGGAGAVFGEDWGTGLLAKVSL